MTQDAQFDLQQAQVLSDRLHARIEALAQDHVGDLEPYGKSLFYQLAHDSRLLNEYIRASGRPHQPIEDGCGEPPRTILGDD